ncbi:hypothetical protein BAU15_08740 [Enterococcus sp. JM4C]|uniref:MarR family winged helix-turn-helix transcriptional regulator n=1 Tax=Candidatus Enterococcus huntleyi TaxID=1857217 RepID=UPI00137A07EE|nr:MarR family transcriptional regulator [Enterococcus sp. JM4C]KAF1296724.1 hypothetical protein BAU15_08740 [Enterococcus sp. JM4C]
MEYKTSLKIRILANELNRKVAEILKEEGSPFSGTQMRILNFIHRHNRQQIPLYQKDIECEFDIRRSTASGMMQTLEKHQLIERKSLEQDNRYKELFLTELGEQKVCENISKLRKFDEQLLAGISEEEQRLFFDLIDKISTNSKELVKESRVTE